MANLAISLPVEVDGSLQKIRDFSTQIGRQVTDTVTEAGDRSWSAVSQTAERAKDSLMETADKAVDGVVRITDTAFDKVNQTAESAIVNPVNFAIDKQLNSIQVWLDSHPTLAWASKAFAWGITHPIISLIAIFLGIFVLRHFIRALGVFLEQTFLFIMQAPFKIGKFILALFLIPLSKLSFKSTNVSQPTEAKLVAVNGAIPKPIVQNHQERLIYILNRLEAIREEQNQLLQEATSILSSNEKVSK